MREWRRALAVVMVSLSGLSLHCDTPAIAQTAQVEVVLAWDYDDPRAAGFALHCGLSSGSYSTRNDVGNTPTATLALIEGAVRFCAVVAYDAQGDESAFSNEVMISVPGPDPVEGLPLSVQEASSTSTGFRLRFNQRIDYGALNLFGGETAGGGDSDVTLVGEASGPVRGTLVVHPDRLGVTFVKSDALLVPDTYVLTIVSRADGLIDEQGRPIDGNGDGSSGDDYSLGFVAPATSNPVVGIGEFARGPGQPVDLPLASAGAGIPVTITNGAAVRDVEFRLQFDPRLLAVQGIQLASGISGQLTAAEIDQSAGMAHVRIASLSGLPGSKATLVSLRAAVVPGAQYRAMHVLDVKDLHINGGALPGIDDDGLHVVAFPGDASGNGSYTSLDLEFMRRVRTGLDTGFSAYPLADPAVVADVSGDGALTDLDETGVVEICASGLVGSTFWGLTRAVMCSLVLP